eukprot:Gb_22573 [translate_table: standard]
MELRKRLMSYGRSPSRSPKSPNEKKLSSLFSFGSLSPARGEILRSPRSPSPKSGSSPVRSLKGYKKLFAKKNTKTPKTEGESSDDPIDSPRPDSNRRRQDEIRELTEVFRYFDADGDGKISAVELKAVLGSLGEELCDKELRDMIQEVDSDGDGCIDLQDFIRLNTRILIDSDAESELREAFRLFDIDQRGCITAKGLHQMMSRLGEDSSLDDCHLMIKQVDFDGDGVVNFREFKHMMTT